MVGKMEDDLRILSYDIPGAALQIDPRQFYTQLYGAITHLDVRKCDVVLMIFMKHVRTSC